MPEGYVLVRRIGPFDRASLPSGLLGEHRLKPDRWGRLFLAKGMVRLVWDDGSGQDEMLVAPAQTLIPPQVPHHLELEGEIELEIAFLAPVG